MSEQVTVLLFDVDGVIVDPLAYKAGVFKSLELLCSEMGLTDEQSLLPTYSDIAYLEACGIHDVWDICNISFALLLINIFRELKKQNAMHCFTSSDTASQLRELKAICPRIVRPDYKTFADCLIGSTNSTHPPDSALNLLRNELSTSSQWLSLFESFLQNTRSVNKSYGTRIFQNIILGSDDFVSTYNLESVYDGPSLLKDKDKVVINKMLVERLKELNKQQDFKVAVYTARPSYPPPDIPSRQGFSPEAEIAVCAASMQDFPLVGMGMMEWLAAKHNERSEDLTKPNTTHSFSALLAAFFQDNSSATLERAYLLNKRSIQIVESDLIEFAGKQINIIVFEDTSSGIKPLVSLAEKLKASGSSITLKAMGVARDEAKRRALAPLCHKLFLDVNEAINYVLSPQKEL